MVGFFFGRQSLVCGSGEVLLAIYSGWLHFKAIALFENEDIVTMCALVPTIEGTNIRLSPRRI